MILKLEYGTSAKDGQSFGEYLDSVFGNYCGIKGVNRYVYKLDKDDINTIIKDTDDTLRSIE